jgi:FtsP/CotA-like multicopper oxidase with cupredoxin domain
MHRIIEYIKCTHTIESVLFHSLSLSLSLSLSFIQFLIIVVFNRLTSNGIAGSLPSYDDYWGKSYQNIHFHGLMVDPNIETNSFAIDGGGSEYVYEFNIPMDHVGGLSWYHNHFHGTASYSSMSGLFGAFIVERDDDPYVTALDANAGTTEEVILLFSELSTEEVNGQNQPVSSGIEIVMSFDWLALTNGEVNPEFSFTKDTTVYFRTVNAGERPPVLFSIDNHTIYPIGADSSYPIPTSSDSKEEIGNVVVIDAGSRIEFAVTFDTPGTYLIRRGGYNFGITGPVCAEFFGPEFDGVTTCISYDKEDIIGTIIVTDDNTVDDTTASVARDGDLNTLPVLTVSPYLTKLLEQPMSTETSKTVTMDLAASVPIFQIPYDGIFQPGGGVGMNMRIGNPHFVSGNFTSGTCEEWTISSNPPGLIPHVSSTSVVIFGLELLFDTNYTVVVALLTTPFCCVLPSFCCKLTLTIRNTQRQTFHIHSVPFLVTSENGIELDSPFWRDTYPVLDNITATVCFPPTDVGFMVSVHCHMPAHQDAGMFGMYKVLPSTTVGETSTTVEGEDDTAAVDDADIEEEKESSATATSENTPTIMLFFALLSSSWFYFL